MTGPRRSWTLRDWLAWLETLSPREIDLGLERVLVVLERMALERPARVLTVAGTNGKGSCAAMLESLLIAGGRRVGCYTSPHVLHYSERIRVDGRPVDEPAIIEAFRAVEARRDGVPLTYFEYGTLAALAAFEARGATDLVLEIGLGGRLDAVNAVEPDGVLITNVTLEHCDWLGDTVEAIAAEKAGVMRAGKPAVFGAFPVPAAIAERARRIDADLRLAGRDYRFESLPSDAAGSGPRWNWQGRRLSLTGLRPPSLHGPVQVENAAAVLALVEALGLGDFLAADRVDEAFGRLAIPGRFQRVTASRDWLLDVAHNPDAARALADSLGMLQPAGGVTATIGVLSDKDLRGILMPLAPQVRRWVAVRAESPRALPARELAQAVAQCSGKPCLVGESVAAVMARLEAHARRDALLLVTGSFYTVGPALRWLQGRRGQAAGS